jgi:hypothetical protein
MAHKDGAATERSEETGLSIIKTGQCVVYHSVVNFWLEDDGLNTTNWERIKMRFRSTGLGNTALKGYLLRVHRSKGMLIAEFQTTEPVQWLLGSGLEPSDIPQLFKVIFRPSLIFKTIQSVFWVKKNPKEPENLMSTEWVELNPVKKDKNIQKS